MSDPRLTPNPARCTRKTAAQITTTLCDLCRTPDGARDRQLLYGDAVTVLHEENGWSYIQSQKDGYVGYIRANVIGAHVTPTHRVSAPATHAYAAPDFKSPDQANLSFGSAVCVRDTSDRFAETPLGHIPAVHLTPVDQVMNDPAAVADRFLGTPYLWGGNSRWGIDCSGLVQAALLACGIPCPGDSDMQESLGSPASGLYQRNDLLFWKGHVALVTAPDMLIHANAATMSTTHEPIETAIARIEAQGDGPVTAHRRL